MKCFLSISRQGLSVFFSVLKITWRKFQNKDLLHIRTSKCFVPKKRSKQSNSTFSSGLLFLLLFFIVLFLSFFFFFPPKRAVWWHQTLLGESLYFTKFLFATKRKKKSKQVAVFCLVLAETFRPGGLGFSAREPELLQGPCPRRTSSKRRRLLCKPPSAPWLLRCGYPCAPTVSPAGNTGSPSPPLPHCVPELFPPFHLPFSPPVLELCWNLLVHLSPSHPPPCSYAPPSTHMLPGRPDQ